MADRKSVTVNAGGAAEPSADEEAREHEIAGNVREQGDDPSPDDRQRGETSGQEREASIDVPR